MAALALRPDRRCLWTEQRWAVARLPRCAGKPERRRRLQRRGEPARLFYIIPRHNRDNLSVCTYVRREERWRPVWVGFFKVHSRNISLDFPEYRFHGKKNLLVSGSRSQPFRAIIIMNSGGAAGPRHPGN